LAGQAPLFSRGSAASVQILKFAWARYHAQSEFQNRRTLATY
jgi:hypothetical protein